jgi:hypothetical protein
MHRMVLLEILEQLAAELGDTFTSDGIDVVDLPGYRVITSP